MSAAPCRVCGVATELNVEVRLGHTPAGMRDASADYAVGTCASCESLDTVAPGSAVRTCLRLIGADEAAWPGLARVLDDLEQVDPAAVMFERTGNPHQGPQAEPFAHVPDSVRAVLRGAYARVLEARVAATLPSEPDPPTAPPADGPAACLACGVDRSVDWHGPLRTFGLTRGPDLVSGYLCDACTPVLEEVGADGQPFVERACLTAQGLPDDVEVPALKAWVATGLPPRSVGWDWIRVLPPTEALDPVTELRERVADLEETVALLRAAAGATT